MNQEINNLRTENQKGSMFQYFQDLANALNEAGVDQKMFIDHLKGWEIPITKEFLHYIWKLKQKKMFLTDSTKRLKKDQVSQVYDAINMFTSTQFGVSADWQFDPDKQKQRIKAFDLANNIHYPDPKDFKEPTI